MPHETSLILTLAAGFALAFLLGFGAVKLRLPALVGYLVAGILIGPHTPGFEADAELAAQLQEIGVILLMFGVGMHLSPGDLLAVKRVSIPGAVVQIAVATALGALVAHGWGWDWGAGIVFGLCLSVASTVVLLRALDERGLIDTLDGRIAVGWLVVEDLVTVLALVLLPALAGVLGGDANGASPGPEHAVGASGVLIAIATTVGKVLAFVAAMWVVGRRFLPWILVQVARTGSRELFTVCVLGLALGIAVGAGALFEVSFALGAVVAGVVVGESDLSHNAASDSQPLQDAFGVLFFVAVGMLFEPAILVEQPLQVLAVLGIVVVGKSIAALGIVLALRYPLPTALTISASLAQIGEFSFILANLGRHLDLLPAQAASLIVAVAILSIALNPILFGTVPAVVRWIQARPRLAAAFERPAGKLSELPASHAGFDLDGHVVLIGHGRVGGPIATALAEQGIPYVVIEQSREAVERLRAEGVVILYGDASRAGILARARLERAKLLVVASPDPVQTRVILDHARKVNPDLDVVVRTHSEDEMEHLQSLDGVRVVMGELEASAAMLRHALSSYGKQ